MRFVFALTGTMIALSACATTGEPETATTVYDPLEDWNRGVYAFNEEVDQAVLEPVARGYRAVTNEPVRQGVSNFLSNLNQPVVFANTVLQGKMMASFDTAARLRVRAEPVPGVASTSRCAVSSSLLSSVKYANSASSGPPL